MHVLQLFLLVLVGVLDDAECIYPKVWYEGFNPRVTVTAS